jgi:negative regulator of sigma E activity
LIDHLTTEIAPPEPASQPEPAAVASAPPETMGAVDLARIGWLAVTLACVIAVVILLTQDYYGYAGVTFAVALSAAINLR